MNKAGCIVDLTLNYLCVSVILKTKYPITQSNHPFAKIIPVYRHAFTA